MMMTGILAFPFYSVFAEEPVLDSGNTAWMIVSTALVMMMTPAGLALFYGGMSRYKNLLNTMAMTFTAYCLSSVVWVMWGYTLAFGSDVGGLGLIGGLNNLATGIFADPSINALGTGLLYGKPMQLAIQLVSILGTAVFTAIGTVIVVWVTKLITGGIRVDEENEIMGLDNSLHGERAFEIE
ncbi:MAG: hypothetical protein KKF30_09685 [Proteobacteria bacterium]|nr:hypothetical protein [Pseudomonadota bacterium]MBU4469514.1 hypothetical protein [Pseudomonadota bacterium]